MKTFRIAVLAATALALPVTSAEAAIPLAKAKATAYRAGVAAAKQTHAHSPKVMSCAVKTSRRDLCKVKLHYASGARTCILDVNVSYKNRSSKTLVYSYGQTLCS